jgi:hypothetical protein
MKPVIALLPQQVFQMNNAATVPKRIITTMSRITLWTAPRIKPPAMNPITNIRITDHRIGFGKFLLKEYSSSWLRVVTDGLWATEEPGILTDPIDSKGPETFLGAPDEFSGPEEMGPDVIRPVVGRTGGIGPEFWRVTPPDWGPDVFFTGSPCLLSGPEFDFFNEAEPDMPEDTGPDVYPARADALPVMGPECVAAPPKDAVLDELFNCPDFLDLEPSIGISNILPNSPDFLISPPV